MLSLLLGPSSNVVALRKDQSQQMKVDYHRFRNRSAYTMFAFAAVLQWGLRRTQALSESRDGVSMAPVLLVGVQLFVCWMLFYYVASALRESVLKLNGSHIRPWWIHHHYWAAGTSCLLLSLPVDSPTFRKAINGFLWWPMLQSVVILTQNRWGAGGWGLVPWPGGVPAWMAGHVQGVFWTRGNWRWPRRPGAGGVRGLKAEPLIRVCQCHVRAPLQGTAVCATPTLRPRPRPPPPTPRTGTSAGACTPASRWARTPRWMSWRGTAWGPTASWSSSTRSSSCCRCVCGGGLNGGRICGSRWEFVGAGPAFWRALALCDSKGYGNLLARRVPGVVQDHWWLRCMLGMTIARHYPILQAPRWSFPPLKALPLALLSSTGPASVPGRRHDQALLLGHASDRGLPGEGRAWRECWLW